MKHKVYGKNILKDKEMSVHHKKHHVKIHNWVDGVLSILHHEFESLEEALNFTNHPDLKDHQVKIYNEDNELVHHQKNHHHDTYA